MQEERYPSPAATDLTTYRERSDETAERRWRKHTEGELAVGVGSGYLTATLDC
jgi:hypothetical protein